MLANRVGSKREGLDTLVLPRLAVLDGFYQIKLSNLAPEVEYISDVQLAAVPLAEGQELDVSVHGKLTVWSPVVERPLDLQQTAPMPVPPEVDVLVLELRNSSAFEDEMREIFLHGKIAARPAGIIIAFDNGQPIEIAPVGTKLLRRVALPIPAGCRNVSITCAAEFWNSRRLWFGRRNDARETWIKPVETKSIRLAMNEEKVLLFPAVQTTGVQKLGYALEMKGYYDFTAPAKAGR